VVRVASRIAPDQAAAETMQHSYRTYRKLYPEVKEKLSSRLERASPKRRATEVEGPCCFVCWKRE